MLNSSECPNDWDKGQQFVDPAYYPHWRQWIAAIAGRYPAAVIEGPNEPDYVWRQHQANPQSYPSAVEPEVAADIQCQLHQAIPAARTVLSMAVTEPASYVQRFIQRGRGCWDAFSFHPYPGGTQFGSGTRLANLFATLRGARTTYGDTSPIWITETGYTFIPGTDATANATQEATYASASRRLYNRLVTMPDVAGVMFHTLRDPVLTDTNRSNPESYFGMFRGDWTPKPRACVFVNAHGGTWPGC